MQSRAQRVMGEMVGSVLCFCAVLTALVAVDPRVRERVVLLFNEASTEGLTSWGYRVNRLADAIVQAVRDQSIDNAPLLLFSVVAAVLVVLMLRT
jgi:hypothetical protein